jgi:hypothetical protein
VVWEIFGSIAWSVKRFPSQQNVQTNSGAHPASCSVGMEVLSWEGKGAGLLKVTTSFHIVARLRVSGTILLLPM